MDRYGLPSELVKDLIEAANRVGLGISDEAHQWIRQATPLLIAGYNFDERALARHLALALYQDLYRSCFGYPRSTYWREAALWSVIETLYAETVWGKRLLAARESGRFTREDRVEARDWFFCACGRLDERIPRDSENVPLDKVLADAGWTFWDAVTDDEVLDAAYQLILIEVRAAQVLAELEVKDEQ